MSFSLRNDRMARSISAASVWPLCMTSSKACSALSFQCQVSSNASIYAFDCSPVGERNRTL
jgi:hypothetical protein